ncbi:MAG: pantoate--beta-alanine ligase [bacterium]
MVTCTTVEHTRKLLQSVRKMGKSIGYVPTMGALHEGHLQLIRSSVAGNGFTTCSIFVNPIQFNNPDDLVKYPRTLEKDKELLEGAGCDLLFAPPVEEMYPGGEKPEVNVDFGVLDKVMEGKFRPGHFHGVAVVVKRLFDIIEPGKAYFGKKDFQQLGVVSHMVHALKLPLEIVPCETVRESDGLAMSSRNTRLTIAERAIAPYIYKVLKMTHEKSGSMPPRELEEWAIRKIGEKPELRVEYFEICNRETLLPLGDWNEPEGAAACTAVFLGDVRLIDNIELFS